MNLSEDTINPNWQAPWVQREMPEGARIEKGWCRLSRQRRNESSSWMMLKFESNVRARTASQIRWARSLWVVDSLSLLSGLPHGDIGSHRLSTPMNNVSIFARIYLQPSIQGDFRCFLSIATGYGMVGVKEGKPFGETAYGTMEVREIRYSPPMNGAS